MMICGWFYSSNLELIAFQFCFVNVWMVLSLTFRTTCFTILFCVNVWMGFLSTFRTICFTVLFCVNVWMVLSFTFRTTCFMILFCENTLLD